ncbi:hypothetical protein HD597_008077 [Nonomuraea thailandensis]|uniref:SH3 domain-containing protein n=1 Tax=Nonomuraea thailandensis TaxID=1188745 RepID=A0A9X2K525_9ACTN|nr:hypothetical protein [Nonomuraea thailandensis]MCP2361057.1 hypothetical protein [Nonomuraea thailandensis]
MRITRATTAGLLTLVALSGLVAAGATQAQARRPYDFGAQGVIIWSEPRAGSGRNGLGYAGQGFESDRSEEHGLYRCGPFESTLWHHGTNATTGIVGWVPACNLTDSD